MPLFQQHTTPFYTESASSDAYHTHTPNQWEQGSNQNKVSEIIITVPPWPVYQLAWLLCTN